MSLPSFRLVILSGLRRRLASRFRCYSQHLYPSPVSVPSQLIQGEFIIQLLNNLLGWILQGKSGLTKNNFTGAPKTLGEEGIYLV